MSREETQEELFDRLLTDLKKSTKAIPASFLDAAKVRLPSLQLAVLSQLSCPDVIKVMESGIFNKGGIKGIADKKGGYKCWPLNDLALFILMATSTLFRPELNEILVKHWENEERKRRSDCISDIDKIMRETEQLISAHPVVYQVSRSNFRKLRNVQNYLQAVKSDLLVKPGQPYPKKFMEKEDRIDSLSNLFQEQVHHKTPETIICEAIATLMELINITMEPSAIRQRIYRKKLK